LVETCELVSVPEGRENVAPTFK